MPLDAKSLRQVLALATHRNFGRAAAALNVSQPALSRSLGALEQALGVQLFDRSRRGVNPTSFGQILIERGGALMAGLDDIRHELELMRGLQSGSLRIGAGLYPAELSVGAAIGRLSSRYPRLRISLRAAAWREIVDAVTGNQVDIAVVELSLLADNAHLKCDPLPRHEGLLVCRPGHPLLSESSLSLHKVFRYPFVGPTLPPRIGAPLGRVSDLFRRDPLTDDLIPSLHVESIALAKRIVASGDAIAALPRALVATELADGSLATLDWRPPWLHTDYGFVYRRDRTLPPAALAFMTEVRTIEARLATVSPDRTRRRRLRGKTGQNRHAKAAAGPPSVTSMRKRSAPLPSS
jgi:DNA-binding transcriptional LysR family regulator